MKVNALTEHFEVVTLLGKEVLFTCLRVDRSTVPEGMYAYDVRHDDDCQGIPVEIQKFVLVNHWGTVITKEPLDLGEYGYLYLEEDDWNYEGYTKTLDEYRGVTQ